MHISPDLDALQDALAGNVTEEQVADHIAVFTACNLGQLRHLSSVLGMEIPVSKEQAVQALGDKLRACMAITTSTVGKVSPDEMKAPLVKVAEPPKAQSKGGPGGPGGPGGGGPPFGKAGGGNQDAQGDAGDADADDAEQKGGKTDYEGNNPAESNDGPVGGPASAPETSTALHSRDSREHLVAAAKAGDLNASRVLLTLPGNRPSQYWGEVVLSDGKPKSRLAVQVAMTQAGVPSRFVAMYQDGCEPFDGSPDAAEFVLGKILKHGKAAAVAVGGAIAKADKMLGKIGSKGHGGHGEGGGHHAVDPHEAGSGDCHWITIAGAAGTTHLCIDGEGNIAKGPKEMTGRSAKEALGESQHAAVDEASAKAKEKSAVAKAAGGPHGASHGDMGHHGSKAGHVLTAAAEHIETAAHFLLHPGSAAAAVAASKVVGGRVGYMKEKIHQAEAALKKRYGDLGGTAICIAGIGGAFAASVGLHHALHHAHGIATLLPGAIAATPGAHLLAAVPVIAAAEVLRHTPAAVRLAGRAVASGIDAVRNAAGKLQNALKGKGRNAKADVVNASLDLIEAITELDYIIATFADEDVQHDMNDQALDIPDATLKAEGKKFWEAMMEAYKADLTAHAGEIQQMGEMMKKAKQSGVPHKDTAAKMTAAASFIFDLEDSTVTFTEAVRKTTALATTAPLAKLRAMAAELGGNYHGDAVASARTIGAAVIEDMAIAARLREDGQDVVAYEGKPHTDEWVARDLAAAGVPAAMASHCLAQKWHQVASAELDHSLDTLAAKRARTLVNLNGRLLRRSEAGSEVGMVAAEELVGGRK